MPTKTHSILQKQLHIPMLTVEARDVYAILFPLCTLTMLATLKAMRINLPFLGKKVDAKLTIPGQL